MQSPCKIKKKCDKRNKIIINVYLFFYAYRTKIIKSPAIITVIPNILTFDSFSSKKIIPLTNDKMIGSTSAIGFTIEIGKYRKRKTLIIITRKNSK